MDALVVIYVLIPIEDHINPRDPQEIKPYIQATKEIYKLYDKINLSV